MNRSSQEISPDWPVWYDPASLLGSAARYIASLSPRFNWVGIYVLKGKRLELGPFIGAKAADQNGTESQVRTGLAVPVRNAQGEILGQIDIDSHTPNVFSPAEEEAVRKVAQELGDLWPERENRSPR